MQKLFSFILCLFLCSFSKGQKITSVENELASLSANNKIEFLNSWVGENYKKHPESALYYSKLCLNLSESAKNYSGAGNALIRIGLLYKQKGNYKKALEIYSKALQYHINANDSIGINKTLFNRANIYMKTEKLDFALKDYFKCLIFFENCKDYKALSVTYNNIGLIYKQIKDFKNALNYYKKSAKISLANNLFSSLYLSNTNIANIHSIQKEFQPALNFYKTNLNLLKEAPNKFRLAQTYHNIGACFLEMEQYQLALTYLKESLTLKKEIGNKNHIISSLTGIAHAFYMMNEFDKSLQYSKEAFLIAKETQNLELQKNSSKTILKIYSYLQISDSIIHYFDIYETLRDSILTSENLQEISEIQAKYEAAKKQHQITLLEKENKNKAMQRNGLLVSLTLLIGFIVFIVRSYYKNKRINRLLHIQKQRIEWHKQVLDQKNKALQESNQTKNKLFQIISHDLRSPLASVAGISKLIPLFLRTRKYDSLKETSNDLEQCINRVLDLTDNLLSWSLNQSGKLPYDPTPIQLSTLFSSNLETYQPIASQKSIYLELNVSNDIFVVADRQMLDTVLRNLINNAIKFTPQGGVIVMGTKLKEDCTEIWIKDSGIGISPDQLSNIFKMNTSVSGTEGEKGNGLGLILCKEFVEQNKGRIWVESEKNRGTTFRFTIPILKKQTTKDSLSQTCQVSGQLKQ